MATWKKTQSAAKHNTKALKRSRLARLLGGARNIAIGGAILFPLLQTACTRAKYRHLVDQETYHLIDEKVADANSSPIRQIDVDPRSRLFDPFNPDRPPMPEDDPASHRYMEIVDKKKGYPLWDVNGRTNTAENPDWWRSLPLDERGVLLLDADTAVRLALLHSPNYQSEIETLYLSALDVSSERFLFDTQFFGGWGGDFTTDGPDRNGLGNSRTSVTSSAFSKGRRPLSMQRRFATGADMVVGMANSLTWQLSGPNTQSASTILDFSFAQPLLRQAGRDVVLERLTLAERTLLYNVRAFERYKTGFYLQVTIGRQAEAGPTRRGGLFGGAGLEGFTGLGGGFGRVGVTTGGGGLGAGNLVPTAGGILGLLQNQIEIRNAEENVARTRDNLLRFEDTLRELLTTIPAGQAIIPQQQLQVTQTRQNLITSQTNLLQRRQQYEQTMDQFKQLLGLPPYICVELQDPLLMQFNLISQQMKQRRDDVAKIREDLGTSNTQLIEFSRVAQDAASGETYREIELTEQVQLVIADLAKKSDGIETIQRAMLDRDLPEILSDLEKLRASLPGREQQMAGLRQSYEQEKDYICSLLSIQSIDPQLFDSSELASLPDNLKLEYDRLADKVNKYTDRLQGLRNDLAQLNTSLADKTPRQKFDAVRTQVILQSQDLVASMAEDVLAMQVLQARARTESVLLPEVNINERDAVEIARKNRLDWMNARASLVDSWRAIEVVADDLESSLDVVFSGDVQNRNDSPLSLNSSTGRLRAGLQWDSPITRLQERNRYRQVLIEYQQAKRSYYQFEDNIWLTLRSQLRNIRLQQINFELQRYAVRIAAQQITINEDIRQINESLNQAAGPTAARDQVSALQDLLNSQNTFLGVWVFYEAQRRNLDQDLGTMQVDGEGLWIDPGPITAERFYLGNNAAWMQNGEQVISVEEVGPVTEISPQTGGPIQMQIPLAEPILPPGQIK